MSAPHAVPGSFESGPDASRVSELLAGLRLERDLLGDLHAALLRQRTAVGEEDIDGVEQSVRDVQRLLLTLNEALERRRSLIGLLTGSETTDLSALSGMRHPPARLQALVEQLREIADSVASELKTARTLLRGAIATGDHYLRTMTGEEDAESLYGRAQEGRPPRKKALLLDRQV